MSRAHEWTFESEHGRHVAAIGGSILVDDADAMQEATMQHLGIAILPDWNATEGIRSGQLETVLPEYSIAALPLHAVYPETHWMSLRARTFLDLLIKRADRFTPEAGQMIMPRSVHLNETGRSIVRPIRDAVASPEQRRER